MAETKKLNSKQRREQKRLEREQAALDKSPNTSAVSLKPSAQEAATTDAPAPGAEAATTDAPKAAKPAKVKAPKPGDGLDPAEKAAIVAGVEDHIRSLGVRTCGCGCGETTARTFKPGHDAILRSRLIKERLSAAAAGRTQGVAATSH